MRVDYQILLKLPLTIVAGSAPGWRTITLIRNCFRVVVSNPTLRWASIAPTNRKSLSTCSYFSWSTNLRYWKSRGCWDPWSNSKLVRAAAPRGEIRWRWMVWCETWWCGLLARADDRIPKVTGRRRFISWAQLQTYSLSAIFTAARFPWQAKMISIASRLTAPAAEQPASDSLTSDTAWARWHSLPATATTIYCKTLF